MPEKVTLRAERDGSDALTTVTISTGWGQTIVFNEGTYYPALPTVESRERDEYVVVRTEHLPLLARKLDVEGDRIEDIFAAVVESARTSKITTLSGARRLLADLEVPYQEETWTSYDD